MKTEEKIKSLENQLRRTQFIMFLMVGVFLLLGFSNQTQTFDVVKTKTFKLVDDDGSVLVEIRKGRTNDKYNSGVFKIYNKLGHTVCELGTNMDDDSGSLWLQDREYNKGFYISAKEFRLFED